MKKIFLAAGVLLTIYSLTHCESDEVRKKNECVEKYSKDALGMLPGVDLPGYCGCLAVLNEKELRESIKGQIVLCTDKFLKKPLHEACEKTQKLPDQPHFDCDCMYDKMLKLTVKYTDPEHDYKHDEARQDAGSLAECSQP